MKPHYQSCQERLRNSSWLSGCQNWHLSADGSNSSRWPDFSFEYMLRTRSLQMAAYHAIA